MRYPQLLVHESDGRTANLLRATAQTQGWSLYELRRPGAGLARLRRGGPNVLVLRVGRNLEGEMSFLEQVGVLFPDTATLVIDDGASAALTNLAWDLGARYVLSRWGPREHLTDIVVGLMKSALATVPHRG